MAKEPARVKKRERKNITSGVAHVNASFNNTMITITDAQGNTISWSRAGMHGLQGLAQVDPLRRPDGGRGRRQEGDGARRAHAGSQVSGPGSGRESALRALQAAGLTITTIRDVTPIPHNGCRPPKRRRV